MFRSFLSWRYLFARRTNLIGMVGILVAVSALILILSIMTGFLEQSRRAMRGSLADVLVQPLAQFTGTAEERAAREVLGVVTADERVAGATTQLVWGGIVGMEGRDFSGYFTSTQTSKNPLVVQIVGVDTANHLRIAWPALALAHGSWGALPARPRIHDESGVTAFFAHLRGSAERPATSPVPFQAFPFQLPEGQRVDGGRPSAGVVVGDQLFRRLRLEVGRKLQIVTVAIDSTTGERSINNRDFVVTGSFRSGDNETDTTRIYLDRRELADFLAGTRAFSQVICKLEDYERDKAALVLDLQVELAERDLITGGRYAESEVLTWESFRGNLLGAIENERVLMGIMLSLVLIVAGFTIFAILSMMVTEKRRDIGILLALGATPRGILDLFLFIACWDAVMGTLFGTMIGTWGAVNIDRIERWLSGLFGIEIFRRDVYVFDHIPSIVEPASVAWIVAGAFVCALGFAAFPAWRAARLDPLEALRYE